MENYELTIRSYALFSFGGVTLLWGIFIIIFSIISIRYLRQKVNDEEGVIVSSWEGGLGVVLINLAMALVFKRLADHPLFPDNKYAVKYARKIDYFFALMLVIMMMISFSGLAALYFFVL